MAVELVREQVFLDQSVGSEQQQILLEGEIVIPDAKPDMALLLQTEERVLIDRTEITADRVNFVGRLNLSVLYIAKAAEKPVHVLTHSQSIDDFANLDGVSKDMWVQTKAEIANVEYRMLNDRKVSFRAIVNVSVQAERSDAHEMVIHIHEVPENQLLKTPLTINRTIEHKAERFSVKDQLALPSSKPNVREILLMTAQVTNRDERLANGRVNLSGELLITTLYRGDTDESLIEFVESTVPFNGPVDISGARDDMFVDVALQVLDHSAQVRPDDDGEDRIIEIDVSVGVQMKVYSTETLSILEDAYCTHQQLNINKTTIHVPRLVCHNRNQTPVKEVVALGAGAPDMLQVFRVRGQAYLDEVKVLEDKVVVEGAITTDILYVAQSDAQPLGSFRTIIPFRQVIEAKGTAPNMRVGVDTSIDHATFNMLSGRETEVRFMLTFNTQVIEEEEARIINDIAFTETDPAMLNAMASMTVYIVQNGDNLWRIAKRYNTPLDELLSVNDIDQSAKLLPGQKLLILKKGL
jgi:LysM repeat protein